MGLRVWICSLETNQEVIGGVYDQLEESGHLPIFSHYADDASAWTILADAVVLVDYPVDCEVEAAKKAGIPVYDCLADFLANPPAPRKQPAAQGGDPRYLALLQGMEQLHIQKAQDYGSDEDPLANLRAATDIGIPPSKGCWLRSKDKVKRIDQWFRKGHLANESIEDSLRDLAAYCLLCLVLLGEEKAAAKEEAA